MLGLEEIELSQKKLYRSVQAELALLEGKKNKEILAYERAFNKDFAKSFRLSSRVQLLKAIDQSQIILVGDFHPFRQSQKCFLRLMQGRTNKNTVIALECFQQSKQYCIEDFLDGHITLDELREESQFEHYWPFSWLNYREILEFAKKNNIKVLALNIHERGISLDKRDEAAATCLQNFAAKHPFSKIYTLYGELHLAKTHLPARLKKISKKKCIVIHQNEPSLYWKLANKINHQKIEVLQLRTHEYCIMNAVPWVKLRSYVDWLEGNPEDDDDTIDPEPSDLMLEYARFLKNTLQLPHDVHETFSVIGSAQLQLFQRSSGKNFTPQEKKILKHSILCNRTNLILQKNIFLLPISSLNSIAESASLLTWISQRKKIHPHFSISTSSMVMQYTIGYLGSKIINPKRKCNEIADLMQARKRKTFSLALSILAPLLPEVQITKKNNSVKRSIPEMEACRIAGYILGERLYLSLTRGDRAIRFIRMLFLSSTNKAGWPDDQLKAISAYLHAKPIKARKKNEQF